MLSSMTTSPSARSAFLERRGCTASPQNVRDISGPSSTRKVRSHPGSDYCLGSEALSVPASGREAVAVRRPRVGHALGETQTLNPKQINPKP